MVTAAQLEGLGRIGKKAREWSVPKVVMGDAPYGVRVWFLNADGSPWYKPSFYTVDPEGNIWTPAGQRPSWDEEGKRQARGPDYRPRHVGLAAA